MEIPLNPDILLVITNIFTSFPSHPLTPPHNIFQGNTSLATGFPKEDIHLKFIKFLFYNIVLLKSSSASLFV